MKNLRLVLGLLSLWAVASACKTESAPRPDEAEVQPVGKAKIVDLDHKTDTHVHTVACGCSKGGACGNLIEVDGKYVPLEGETGLGEMAFCGKDGLQAKVEGAVQDGKFVARSFEMVSSEPN